MTKPDLTEPVDKTPAPEPSRTDQVDIGDRVQKDLGKASDHRREQESPASGKATQFDGNPNPEKDDEGGMFRPRDDTPSVLPEKEG
ncbi:hypothetical protein [Achromobacter aloeverae]|uniref:Uncharacterized protein n=1 Tax=Achromobacter aloeverae TaxID=1750518 RepID=A0A4Q1HND7_9BURK|nr:hypothetical protein [Achromobacter aloeverae]RXN92297.1 hypothetical protein C7R54_00585 [Achromobacter aloeverae]